MSWSSKQRSGAYERTAQPRPRHRIAVPGASAFSGAGTGYQNDVAALRQFAADIGGDELLAEYKNFVADLALREHGKVEKIDKFFEPHLKNAGFSGNFTIRDVFDRKSKVSKWMKTRKK